jgi:hypothetical protein
MGFYRLAHAWSKALGGENWSGTVIGSLDIGYLVSLLMVSDVFVTVYITSVVTDEVDIYRNRLSIFVKVFMLFFDSFVSLLLTIFYCYKRLVVLC